MAYRARYRHAPPTTQPEHPIGDGAVKRAFPVRYRLPYQPFWIRRIELDVMVVQVSVNYIKKSSFEIGICDSHFSK